MENENMGYELVVSLHSGSQSESWLEIYRSGDVVEVIENDGAYALRHGSQRRKTPGRVEDYLHKPAVRAAWEAIQTRPIASEGDSDGVRPLIPPEGDPNAGNRIPGVPTGVPR